MQYLNVLHTHLNNADYAAFWTAFDEDDLYADLTADVHGFEEIMRVRIAAVVSECMQAVARPVLEEWLNVQGSKFEAFVRDICGWRMDGDMVQVPLNKENEAKGTVVRENVKFEQFGRLVKRAYEQPA